MQYNKKSVEDIDVSGKKVIVRCDFNVPQDDNGNITDDKRIRASLRDHQLPAEPQRSSHPVLSSGPPEGRGQHEVLAGSGCRSACPSCSVRRSSSQRTLSARTPRSWLPRFSRATLSCSRTFVSRRARPRMTQLWQRLWPTWLRSTSTTPSAPHTAHTLPPQASQITCRLYAASSSRRRSPSWARL